MPLFHRPVTAHREPLAQFLARIVDYPELVPLAEPLVHRLTSESADQDRVVLSTDEGNLLKILVEGFAFRTTGYSGQQYTLWLSLTSSFPNFGLNPFRIPFFVLNPHWGLRFPPSHQALLEQMVQEQVELVGILDQTGSRWARDELIFDYEQWATVRNLLDQNQKEFELLYADLNLSRISVISDRLRLIRQRLAEIAGPPAGNVGPESKPDILWLTQTDSYEAYERDLPTNMAGPWKQHVQQSRQNILETAGLIQRGIRGHTDPAQRPVVMILGAGSCSEIPLEELVKDYFVILVDINKDLVDRAIQRLSDSSKDAVKYVRTEIRDITGGVTLSLAREAHHILEKTQTTEEAKTAFIKALENKTPSDLPDLTGLQPVDLLISSLVSNEMVYSTFFRFREEFEKKFGTKLGGADIDQAFQDFQIRMTTGHAKALAHFVRTRGALAAYVSEMKMEYSDDPLNPRPLMRQPDGKNLHRLDALFEGEKGIEVVPWRRGQWRWPVSREWGISYAVESLILAPHRPGDRVAHWPTWNPLQNQRHILRAEERVTENRKGDPDPALRPVVMVAGAGRCMDIPLQELASGYRVILVDLDARALRWALNNLDSSLLPYVTLEIEDLTGGIVQEADEGLKEIIKREWNPQKAEMELFKYLERITKQVKPTDLTGGTRVDFFISSMLASVISLGPFLNLKKEWARRYTRTPFPPLVEKSFGEFDEALLTAHAQSLADYILGSKGIVYFSTDVREISSVQPTHFEGRKTPRDIFGRHLADYFAKKWEENLTIHEQWQSRWPMTSRPATLEVQGVVLGSTSQRGMNKKSVSGKEIGESAIDLAEESSKSSPRRGNQSASPVHRTGMGNIPAVRLHQMGRNVLRQVVKL